MMKERDKIIKKLVPAGEEMILVRYSTTSTGYSGTQQQIRSSKSMTCDKTTPYRGRRQVLFSALLVTAVNGASMTDQVGAQILTYQYIKEKKLKLKVLHAG